MSSIKLGDKVKDVVSGFEGIATARTEFLNGCIRWSVDPPLSKSKEFVDGRWFDEHQLVVVSTKTAASKLAQKAVSTGGPRPDAKRARDASRRSDHR